MSTNAITADAIKEIERLAKASVTKEQFLRRPGDSSTVVFQLQQDGSYKPAAVVVDRPDAELLTPDDFVTYAEQEGTAENSIVYYNEEEIVLLRNKEDGISRARCALPKSPQFAWLQTKSNALNQQHFIRALRIDLRGCFMDNTLLNLVRALKWTSGAQTAGVVQHGKESMGRQINSEVTGEGALPEEVMLNVSVFENYLMPMCIACAVEIYPAEQAFRLTPYPMELKNAVKRSLEQIAIVLAKQPAPIYHGKPV